MIRKITLTSILIFIFMISFVAAKGDLSYSLTLNYDKQSLTLEELNLKEGGAPDRLNQLENGFTAKVISFDGEIIHSFKFVIDILPDASPPKDIFDEEGNQIKEPSIDSQIQETSIVLIVPYFKNAKSIEIYEGTDNLMLVIDVSKYAVKSNFGDNIIYFIIGAMILILIVAIIYKRKAILKKIKKSSKKEEKSISESEESEVSKFCSKCGNKIGKGKKFCSKCGFKLE